MGSGPVVIAYLVLGRLLVWTVQTSGPSRRIWALHPLLEELGDCDFCVGCWVFPLLALLLEVNLLAPVYVPAVSEIITGIATAFAVHLARLGWQSKFGVEVLS